MRAVVAAAAVAANTVAPVSAMELVPATTARWPTTRRMVPAMAHTRIGMRTVQAMAHTRIGMCTAAAITGSMAL